MKEMARPGIDMQQCNLCGDCLAACPCGALSISASAELVLDEAKCEYCGDCEEICPMGAVNLPYQVVIPNEPLTEVD
ncbi:MAG: ATP-binding protein [Anaerolineae bacterium]